MVTMALWLVFRDLGMGQTDRRQTNDLYIA